MKLAAIAVVALIAVSVSWAKVEQTFTVEGSFAYLFGITPAELNDRYDNFRPGFGIACNYLLQPIPYVSAGGRVSYARVRDRDERDIALNQLGLGALVRPQYSFNTSVATRVFGQVGTGVYRKILADGDRLHRNSLFAVELGGGVAIGSIEAGATYNLGIDQRFSDKMRWLQVFAALRLKV